MTDGRAATVVCRLTSHAYLMTPRLPPFADAISAKLQKENVFTIAKRNVEGQDMLYLSIKFINGLWSLLEIKVAPGSSNITVSSGGAESSAVRRGVT